MNQEPSSTSGSSNNPVWIFVLKLVLEPVLSSVLPTRTEIHSSITQQTNQAGNRATFGKLLLLILILKLVLEWFPGQVLLIRTKTNSSNQCCVGTGTRVLVKLDDYGFRYQEPGLI